MTFFASFLVFFSSLLCASEAGWIFVGVCALLCLALSFWVRFLPVKTPLLLRPIAVVSLFLRLYPLWGLGVFAPPVFFALILIVTVVIAFDRAGEKKVGLLASSAVLFSLLLMLCSLLCLAGKFVFPKEAEPLAYAGILASFLCPLSSALLLPSVKGKQCFPPLALLLAVLAMLPVMFFSFPIWKEILLTVSSPVVAACELRILCGREA